MEKSKAIEEDGGSSNKMRVLTFEMEATHLRSRAFLSIPRKS